MKALAVAIICLFLVAPARAEPLEETFADSDAMVNNARAFLFENDGASAAEALKIAKDLLANAKKEKNAEYRQNAAINAWFAAAYAAAQNGDYRADAKLQTQIDKCLQEIAGELNMGANAPRYLRRARDFLAGKLPDHCGINKGATPITGDINRIILDDGIGNRRVFYYHAQNNADSPDCGKLSGAICFNIAEKIPATPALRQSGVTEDTLTFIEECVVPD